MGDLANRPLASLKIPASAQVFLTSKPDRKEWSPPFVRVFGYDYGFGKFQGHLLPRLAGI